MNRIELINTLLANSESRRYLEIGCAGNKTFDAINAESKVGVDPARGGTVRATSDDFFNDCREEFDVVFVDGLHLHEQVVRDVRNSLARLNPHGVIILHDCLPRQEKHQLREQQRGAWNGDVWKAVVELRQDPNCDTVTFDRDWGLGVVLSRPNSAPLELRGDLSWSRFQRQRDELMRIVNEEQLAEFLNPRSQTSTTSPQILSDEEVNDTLDGASTGDEPASDGEQAGGPASLVHLVLTRFNVGNLDPVWLNHRMELFERFTLPSMRAQTSDHFEWLLACDNATPEPWRSRIADYEDARTRILWLDGPLRISTVTEYVKQLESRQEFSHVITTRLDNDDAVRSDFVERIQSESHFGDREFLNFSTGYVWFEGRVLRQEHFSNSFISCVEPASDIKTVHCEQHGQLSRVGPIRQIATSEPYWMRVCHDRNKLNRPPNAALDWDDDEVASSTFAFTGSNRDSVTP